MNGIRPETERGAVCEFQKIAKRGWSRHHPRMQPKNLTPQFAGATFSPAILFSQLLVLVLFAFFGASAVRAADAPRERISFNDGWRFAKGDADGVGDTLS